MNDRIFEALSTAGLSTSPLSTLDHTSAQASTFFALYDDELVYHEAGRSSRVPLRDVTRIHSDREGVLRVETSDRTAVTASLLGYDPGRVQTFFQQVRDVTARAKELPVVPLNQAPLGQPKVEPAVRTVTGSSIPSAGLTGAGLSGTGLPGSNLSRAAMPGISAYTPAVAPVAPVVVTPAPVALSSQNPLPPVAPVFSPVRTTPPELSKTALTPVPTEQQSTGQMGNGQPSTEPLRPSPRPEPVVISSMPPVSSPPPFQERAGERSRQATRTALPAELPLPAASTPGVHVHTQGALVSVPAPGSPADTAGEYGSELLRRADSVGSLARTVGLLAVVLGLAALALSYFQWQAGNGINAIWTLLAGGVGAVALLAFAEALRLLAALARSHQRE